MFRFRRILLCCLALAACTDRKERAVRTLREVGPEVLRKDGALLYKDQFGGRGSEFSVVGESAWPGSFRRFAPRRVGAYPDGFSLALETDADTERGIFVIPQHFTSPRPGGPADASFEPLAEGIFWYAFTRGGPGRD